MCFHGSRVAPSNWAIRHDKTTASHHVQLIYPSTNTASKHGSSGVGEYHGEALREHIGTILLLVLRTRTYISIPPNPWNGLNGHNVFLLYPSPALARPPGRPAARPSSLSSPLDSTSTKPVQQRGLGAQGANRLETMPVLSRGKALRC